MPTLFIGHGSPMNAIETNAFTEALSTLGKTLPRPKGILCVSAHWMTEGSWVTAMKTPRTIHDFHGFPKPLFDVQYPAPGSPEVADAVRQLVSQPKIHLDQHAWGLDHGTWSVLRHLYPDADIPVIQLSIDLKESFQNHFDLATRLRPLRDQGILIVGSGNVVHNLRQIDWNPEARPFSWATDFDSWVNHKLVTKKFDALYTHPLASESGRLSHPTPDHYIPLLYTIGASDEKDTLSTDFEGMQHASLSMRTFHFG